MDPRLLDILCCPLTRSPLRALAEHELAALNRSIAQGEVRTGGGAVVGQPLQAGLVTRDGRTVYRIEDRIPILIGDEAIALPTDGAIA